MNRTERLYALVEELRAALSKPSAPTPSVETILHAILPHAFVDHTHADALMAITNTPDGEARVREVLEFVDLEPDQVMGQLPAALSGILAAVILGISRAVGETMIVALAAGAGPLAISTPPQASDFSPFKSGETMTGHIVRISGGDLSYNTIDYNSIFAIGITLFVMTFVLNIVSRLIVQRFREVYD